MGRSDLTLKINIIKNLLIFIPVTLGIWFNIYWMLVADVIRGYICYYLNAYYSRFLLNYPIEEQVKDILPSFGVALGCAVPTFLLSFLPLPSFVLLIAQVAFGLALSLVICEKSKLPEYLELKGIAMPIINKIIKKIVL